MKRNKGAIKIKTIVEILLISIIILFAIVVFFKINKKEKSNTNSINTVNQNSIVNNVGKTDVEELGSDKIDTEELVLTFLKLENNKQNMIYSPLSIKYGLKMLQEGASENTYAQIEKVVGKMSLPTYNNIEKRLALANGIYIKDTYSKYVKNSFIQTLTNKYNAEVKYDAFANANNVNAWIENKTLGIIKNILKDDQVEPSNLILINALAIDMEWKVPFDCSDTYGDTFNLVNETEMTATMMNQTVKSDSASYYKEEDATILTMDLKDYDNTQMEFVAIMPEEDLDSYIKNIRESDIANYNKKLILASNTKAGIKIKLPKFSFDYDLKLKEHLKFLGITDAFDYELADFSDMAETSLYVDEALHKADIELSEDGVKAAAVTVFTMKTNSIMIEEPPIEITIDKPFLFLIRDKNTKEVWFTGTVYEPNSWEDDKDNYTIKW